jgi:glucose-1-phosphate cytidylyltransferase
MKVVILAGGLGTRFAEETEIRPKPMIEIGGYPILWHIMKIYAAHGFNEFFVALGYKGEIIKRYFLDYYSLNGSMTVNLATGKTEVRDGECCEDWTVNLIDTGQATMTGGRLKRLAPYLKDAPFMITYGDGVCNVNARDLLRFHQSHGKLGTVTAVRPPARYGELLFREDSTVQFSEKPQTHAGWINGGFIVFEPQVLDYLSGDESIMEIEALERLAEEKQLVAYRHEGFWQCMDTLRDKRQLEAAWKSGDAPWKIWK